MPAPGGNYKDTETASRGYASKTTETRGGGGSASGGRGPSGPSGEARSSPAGNAGGSPGSTSRSSTASDRGPAGGNSPTASNASRGPSGIGSALRAASAAMSDSYSKNRGPNFGSLGNMPELRRSMFGGFNPGGSMLNSFNNADYNALSRANAFGAFTNRERPNVVTQSMVSNYTPYGSPQVMGTGFQNLRNYVGAMGSAPRKDQSRLGAPSFDKYAALRSAGPVPGMNYNGQPQTAPSFNKYAALRSAGAVPGMDFNGPPQSAPSFDKYAALRSAGVVPGMDFNGANPVPPSRAPERSFMDQMALNRRRDGLAEYGKRFSQINPPPALMKDQSRIPPTYATGRIAGDPRASYTPVGGYMPKTPGQAPFRNFANDSLPPGYRDRYFNEKIIGVEDYNGDIVSQPAAENPNAQAVSPSQEYDGPANISPSQQYDGPANVAPSQETGSLGILNDNNSSGGSDNIKTSKEEKKVIEKAVDLLKKGEPITPEMLANLPPEVAALFTKMFPNMVSGGKGSKPAAPWAYPTLLEAPYTMAG